MIYKTGDLPYPFRRYGVETFLYAGYDYSYIEYHNTRIVSLETIGPISKVYITTGGWSTKTTKQRINHFLRYMGIPTSIYQKDYVWYMSHNDEPFHDGIVLAFNHKTDEIKTKGGKYDLC